MRSKDHLIRRALAYAALTPILGLGALGCHRSPDSKLATHVSTLPMTDKQKSLWQQAGNQDRAPGLSKLEQGNVVTARRSSPVVSQPSQTPSVGPDFPPGLTNGLR